MANESIDYFPVGGFVDINDRDLAESSLFHCLPWSDFDRAARGELDCDLVLRLRAAERSRRLLLLRALVDEVGKAPELAGPLPSPEDAWELLARVEVRSPEVFEFVLAHPYTGSWVGYTIRLLRHQIAGVCPLWMHIGHLNSLAAAAAIRSGLEFTAVIPVWKGTAILPSLGAARLETEEPCSVARVRGTDRQYIVSNQYGQASIPDHVSSDAAGWWGLRSALAAAGSRRLEVRLDDLDPYRGLYEPIEPQRLMPDEIDKWRELIDGAWKLLIEHSPTQADALSLALDSLVPKPRVPFRNPSASTGEAFGSAILARSTDAVALADTLVHEFRHMILGGILHLAPLYTDDTRERFYVPWRDDPRPLSRVLQGLYAFAGVTAFWRALKHTADEQVSLRAEFEFAYWRGEVRRVLDAVWGEEKLTEAGRRLLDGIAQSFRPYQDETVSADTAHWAGVVAADHYAGWRLRHLRADERAVTALTESWLAGRRWAPFTRAIPDPVPTPVPDGQWSSARVDLIRLRYSRLEDDTLLTASNATAADIAYAHGHWIEAAKRYQAELNRDPDSPSTWIGLGLALAETNPGAASQVLVTYPELVRAVYRRIRLHQNPPIPVDLATWIGQVIN